MFGALDGDERLVGVAERVVRPALALMAAVSGRFDLFYYLPTEGRWSLSIPPGVVAMNYYVRALAVLAFAALFAALAALVHRRFPRLFRRTRVRTAVWLGVTASAWSALFAALTILSS